MTDAIPPSILVAEDESLLRMMASDLFESSGFRVLEASSGEAAAKILGEQPIAALFTDIELGGDVDGCKLARIARDCCPDVALMVVSGRQSPTAEELPPGAQFLSKPYDLQQVIAAINRMLPKPSQA